MGSARMEHLAADPGSGPTPSAATAPGDGAERPWLAHYSPNVPATVDIPDRPLTWILDEAVRRHGARVAVEYYGTKLSYVQLEALADRFARALLRLGLQRGDRVALCLANVPQFPVAFFGVLKAGGVVVPTNPLYTAPELEHQLRDAGARFVVALDLVWPTLASIRDKTAVEQVIITSPADYLPPALGLLYRLKELGDRRGRPREGRRGPDPTTHDFRALLGEAHTRQGYEVYPLPEPARPHDLAVLQYTGGTTGISKGAMLTHRNLLANAFQTRYWTPRARDGAETTLCVAPFFHSYGLTVGMNLSILAAATMVLLPRFKAKDVVRAIRRYRPSIFPGIPTMYIAIMREAGQHAEYLSSVKYCISGAAPLPAKVQSDFEAMSHGKVVEGYGLSEASPVTHCNPLTEECRNGSIGLPIPNVEAAIIDSETGKPLPPGEVGEIVVKGPNIMKGYWNREQETKDVFIDGWMRTGDIGRMDEDGYFYVVERKKDLIIASGFNVYPREVEEVLFRHPAVADAAVAGAPDEYRGETVAAFIVLKPGIEPSEQTKQDILAFCKQELAAYKVPKILEFRKSLPRSLIGKVLRRELKVGGSGGQ